MKREKDMRHAPRSFRKTSSFVKKIIKTCVKIKPSSINVSHKLWRDQLTELVLALETKLARFQGERYRVVSPGHGAPRQDHGRLHRPGGHRLYTLSNRKQTDIGVR